MFKIQTSQEYAVFWKVGICDIISYISTVCVLSSELSCGAAYEVLSDAEKRKQYDLTGDEKGQGFGGSQGGHGGGNFGGQYGGHQYQSGGPSFQGGGPGGRTFTFTFGGPNQQAGQGGRQGFSQFFDNSQSQRQSRQRQNTKKDSGEESGWARNMYNKFTGNEEGNPGTGFGNFGNFGNFGGFGGGMFDNLFSTFTEGGGHAKEAESNAWETVDLPKGIENLSPQKFKTQVLGTSKTSWAVLYFVPDYPGIGDRLKVLASFADEMKGVLKVRLFLVIEMPLLVLSYNKNLKFIFASFLIVACKQFYWLCIEYTY